MHFIDWLVLGGTLFLIVAYGVWKSKKNLSAEGYLKGNDTPWWAIGLSIMATQASAITFLSTPGQAYDDGMRFVQFYFGMPIAMIILCVFVLPLYYKLNVYTAYEYLETKFDRKTRTLTAVLFLIQRALAAGLTIFAPSIILSSILGWNLSLTNILIGVLVIIYTVAGGTNAVTQTQKQQMTVIFIGIFIALFILINKFPPGVSLDNAVHLAGKFDKLNILDFSFDPSDRYTVWTGIFASVFLFLSYFGTDQSQVQRYLGGRSLAESRIGLLFNGLLKVPMQFIILFIGLMVFVFFQFNETPLHFNKANVIKIQKTEYAIEYDKLEIELNEVFNLKKEASLQLNRAITNNNEEEIILEQSLIRDLLKKEADIRNEAKQVIQRADPDLDTEDNDYVFIHFVLNFLPVGIIGLLLAVIFSAAMSSTASEINALSTTTCIDIYKRSIVTDRDESHYVIVAKWLTVFWGGVALSFALVANLFDNLIEAVNIIGSLFYGTILGVFAMAFLFKKVASNAVFVAAILTEISIIAIYFIGKYNIELPLIGQLDIAYLWLNLIGCLLVISISVLLNSFMRHSKDDRGINK